jgi:hypothetical protein
MRINDVRVDKKLICDIDEASLSADHVTICIGARK